MVPAYRGWHSLRRFTPYDVAWRFFLLLFAWMGVSVVVAIILDVLGWLLPSSTSGDWSMIIFLVVILIVPVLLFGCFLVMLVLSILYAASNRRARRILVPEWELRAGIITDEVQAWLSVPLPVGRKHLLCQAGFPSGRALDNDVNRLTNEDLLVMGALHSVR